MEGTYLNKMYDKGVTEIKKCHNDYNMTTLSFPFPIGVAAQ